MAKLEEEEKGLEDEEEGPSPEKKTEKKERGGSLGKMIALMVLTSSLVMGGSFALYYKFLAPSSKTASPTAEEATGTGPAHIGLILHLDSFVANLSDDAGKRYLKVGVDLEVSNPELETEIQEKSPALKDAVLVIISSKSYDDISDARGKALLREEIISRINPFLKKGTIRKVYFSEFVIQ